MGLRGPECTYCYTCLMNVKPISIDGQPAIICPGCGNVYTRAHCSVCFGPFRKEAE